LGSDATANPASDRVSELWVPQRIKPDPSHYRFSPLAIRPQIFLRPSRDPPRQLGLISPPPSQVVRAQLQHISTWPCVWDPGNSSTANRPVAAPSIPHPPPSDSTDSVAPAHLTIRLLGPATTALVGVVEQRPDRLLPPQPIPQRDPPQPPFTAYSLSPTPPPDRPRCAPPLRVHTKLTARPHASPKTEPPPLQGFLQPAE
jgi:hypothetical protein